MNLKDLTIVRYANIRLKALILFICVWIVGILIHLAVQQDQMRDTQSTITNNQANIERRLDHINIDLTNHIIDDLEWKKK